MSDFCIYIISQVCVIIALVLQGITFLVYNRHRQLSLNICTNLFYCISYLLLGGYVAVVMGVIAIVRDSVQNLLIIGRERGIVQISYRMNSALLVLWIILLTGGCVLTVDGYWSVLPYFSTLIFTVAIWQSNLLFYRCAGCVANVLGVIYNIYLFNFMGIVFQTGVSLFSLVGIVAYFLHQEKISKM